MALAELEVYQSRPIAPTRRVALGRRDLPVDPAPGFGGILLGGVAAAFIERIDPDLHPDLVRLSQQVEHGYRIPQPRLRHRFQTDRIGLSRSRHRLLGVGDALEFEFDEGGAAASQILGAVYAAGRLDVVTRPPVMDALRRAIRWNGPVGPALVAHLTGAGRGSRALPAMAMAHPEAWALGVLGFLDDTEGPPARDEVQRRFRALVRAAHPDHGGEEGAAAGRINDLTEARRILLS